MTVSAFAAVLFAFFIAAASPGPATLAVATTAMGRGLSGALPLALGLSVGLAFWGVAAAVGLGAVLQQSVTALFVLRLAGGAYLIYLAWQSARSALSGHDTNGVHAPVDGKNLFRRGLILNLSNPKAVLAWMAVLSLGMGAYHDPVVLAWTTAACALLGGLIYAAYAAAFAHASIRAVYKSWRRAIDGAVAAGFGYAGYRLITSRSEL